MVMNNRDKHLVEMYIRMKSQGYGKAALEHKFICKDRGFYSAVSKMNQYDDHGDFS
jgi:hypothetical protein